jgi:hypothetical protein
MILLQSFVIAKCSNRRTAGEGRGERGLCGLQFCAFSGQDEFTCRWRQSALIDAERCSQTIRSAFFSGAGHLCAGRQINPCRPINPKNKPKTGRNRPIFFRLLPLSLIHRPPTALQMRPWKPKIRNPLQSCANLCKPLQDLGEGGGGSAALPAFATIWHRKNHDQ